MTKLAKDAVGNTLPAFRWSGQPQVLRIGEVAALSQPFRDEISVVYVLSTADFRFALGKNPVATAKCPRLPANALVPLRVYGGEQISVIQYGDEVGEVEVTEME